jgi:hypothetical protein
VSIMPHSSRRSALGDTPERTKHEAAVHKRKMKRIYILAALSSLVCVLVGSSFYFGGFIEGSSVGSASSGSKSVSLNSRGSMKNDSSCKVALVDALSSCGVDGGFDDDVKTTLHGAGLGVDVYRDGQVTVDFLMNFPGGYDLVIFRVHSAMSTDGHLYLFTAEPFSSDEYSQQQSFGLVREAYATESSQGVFAVDWGFVERDMTGKFNGTVVVVMGCDGANDPLLAEEFEKQGASGYVGWNGSVLLSHSDDAVLHLVEEVCVSKLPLKEAVNDTNSQVGPDPASESILNCYIPY